MYLDEFDYVVVGNEPAGLWLLGRLARTPQEDGKLPRCGWLRLNPGPEPIPFPALAATEFGISVHAPWYAEVVSPDRNLLWRREAIEERFPGLPDNLWDLRPPFAHGPRPQALGPQRLALTLHPDLLGYATALWKALGRTQALKPEALLWGASLLTELFYWSPETELPESVTVIDLDPQANPLVGVKAVEAALSIEFQGQRPLLSRRWILNLSFGRFAALCGSNPELERLLSGAEDPRGLAALYRLTVEADGTAVGAPVPPLTVRMDCDVIPEWNSEVWPFFTQRTKGGVSLELLASAPTGAPLDAVLEQFRQGVGRLNRLFPFLPRRLRHLGVPLNMDTCSDSESRRQVESLLSERAVELYAHTTLHTTTRSKCLWTLFPSLRCELPYPLGPLGLAQELLTEFLARPKRRSKNPSKDAPAAPPA